MAKFFITAPVDYIMGYLKYGHFEGEIEVPDSEIERSLVVIEKKVKTPGKYPRKAGTPLKEPIQ